MAAVRAWLVCVGFRPAGFDITGVTAVHMTGEQNIGSPPETESVQHGSFLCVIDCVPDDTIVYCDGDMLMQRPFTPQELKWLEMLPHECFASSWNAGPKQTLLDEARRLRPRLTEGEIIEMWGESISSTPCLNIGVAVARASTWRRIHEGYMLLWDDAGRAFAHRARQQWLVCYVAQCVLGLELFILPYKFHTHGHFELPQGAQIVSGLACIDGRIICFRHRF